MAKEFHYPGQELNGTWQVVKHDYRDIKDTNSPAVKKFLDPLNNTISAMLLLPDGQKISFELTGESQMISPLQHPRSGMNIGMKLIFPLDKRLCNSGFWKFLCDKNGNFDLEKSKIKNNSYIITKNDAGMLNPEFLVKRQLAYMKVLWPNIKNYSYNINFNDGTVQFDVYPMRSGDEILIFSVLDDGSSIGLLLKRIK